MRYRKVDANGDYVWGGGLNSFYINQPEAVAQAIMTRLRLQTGEWFLDTSDGIDWNTKVLGKYTESTRDPVILQRVSGTTGFLDYTDYSSQLDASRHFFVTMTVDTIYGQIQLATPI